MKHSYMVSENYNKTMTVVEALRELVANAFDAEVEHKARATFHYDAATTKLRLVSPGAKADLRALYFGESTKAGADGLIGQFGEGLKLAMLVCCRHGMSMTVHTGTGLVWKPALEHDAHGVRCLVVHESSRARTRQPDFEVTVVGVTPEQWRDVQAKFLRLHPSPERWPTSLGEVLPDLPGRNFVRGVEVGFEPDLRYGYNFFNVRVTRDRTLPDNFDRTQAMANMWAELCTSTRPELVDGLFGHLVAGDPDFGDLVYTTFTPELSTKLVERFHARFGSGAMAVSTEGMADEVRGLGFVPVVLPYHGARLFRRLCDSDAVLARRRREITTRLTVDDLTPAERAVLHRALALVPHDQPVEIAVFLNPEVKGLYADGTIVLARSILTSFGETVVTLAHELAHNTQYAHGRDHAAVTEQLLIAALEALWKNSNASPSASPGGPPSP